MGGRTQSEQGGQGLLCAGPRGLSAPARGSVPSDISAAHAQDRGCALAQGGHGRRVRGPRRGRRPQQRRPRAVLCRAARQAGRSHRRLPLFEVGLQGARCHLGGAEARARAHAQSAHGLLRQPATAPGRAATRRRRFRLCSSPGRIRDLYARCDVWVTASRSEGFNLPAMEAMACRTPVVATRTGWPEEAVVTGKNGVLVDVDDVAGLAQGVEWVLSRDDTAWRALSQNACATVASSSWQHSTEMFEEALRHACRRAARGEIEGRSMPTNRKSRASKPWLRAGVTKSRRQQTMVGGITTIITCSQTGLRRGQDCCGESLRAFGGPWAKGDFVAVKPRWGASISLHTR